MKAFISTTLGFDLKQENLDSGILGSVKAYYGCVEAQGRGTFALSHADLVGGRVEPKPNYSTLQNLGRIFVFLTVLGRTTVTGSIPVRFPCEYPQLIRNSDSQFSLSSDFLPGSQWKLIATSISVSPPIALDFLYVYNLDPKRLG